MASQCELCDGTGFRLHVDERGISHSIRCECEELQQGERLLRIARIPRRYEHCTLENFEVHHPSQQAAIDLLNRWADSWPVARHGLLLIGPPGTGKTHLAVALAKRLIAEKKTRVLFYEQRELLKALQGTFDSGSEQRESEILGPVIRAELTILDDLGAGRTTPWAKDVMHDVIAQRYNDDRPLLMTSNHWTGDEKNLAKGSAAPLTLRDRLGDALMSRLYEMCRIVRIAGDDYRSGILHARHHF